jgi:hypothetical protein
MVFYANTCTPAFKQAPNSVRVPINITDNDFALTDDYGNMCYGDSVYATFQLLDDHYSNPSPCDTIQYLDVLSGHSVIRQIRTSPTEKMLVFAPFTGLYDTIKVKAKGSLVGVEEDFKLFLRKPKSPDIQSDPVCKNTAASFTVSADCCDTIYNVECPDINDILLSRGSQEWTMYVPDLPNTTSFQCQVTYFSKLQNDTVKNFSINHTLQVWTDPPKLSVSLMHNNSILPFDETTQNLCLGDSLLFTFSTPHNCDTITGITWLQNSGTLNYESPHTHTFIVKPTQEGDNTYRAKVQYKHPKGTTNPYIEITYIVQVKRRPRLFINPNPPDTLKYCYPDDAPLNLNQPAPTDAIIDYNFVASGPGMVNFVPNGLPSFKPTVTGNYVVEANYLYMCSEMNTTLTQGKVRIVVNKMTTAYIITPPSEGFCELSGITIESFTIKSSDETNEGINLRWKHDGNTITFPFKPPAGTYTLTAFIDNACYPSNSPQTHSISNVRVVPVPEVKVMPDITVCRGDSVALEVVPGSFVGDTLIWRFLSGKITKDTVKIDTTTTFRAHASNACRPISKGLSVYDEVTVSCMPDAAVQLMPDTSACLYDEIWLRVVQKEGDVISWSSSHHNYIPDEGEGITVLVDGNETYTAVITNQCGSYSASLNVEALYLPSVTVKSDTAICHGAFLNFSDCLIGTAYGITLQWRPGQGAILTEPGRYITDSDIYIATVSTEKCGSDSDTIYVNVYPPLILLPDNSNLPRYNNQDPYDISFQTLQAVPPLSYSISGAFPPGLTMINGRISGKPVLGPYDYNTHHLQVSVTDGHQCQTSREYILAPEWKAATVLLPVGNAENAVFLPGYNLEVYNRNGLLLHKGMGWNGVWNNTFVPSGTYFYNVKILIDDRPEDRMGYVVVMYY